MKFDFVGVLLDEAVLQNQMLLLRESDRTTLLETDKSAFSLRSDRLEFEVIAFYDSKQIKCVVQPQHEIDRAMICTVESYRYQFGNLMQDGLNSN